MTTTLSELEIALLRAFRILSTKWTQKFSPAMGKQVLPTWRDICTGLPLEYFEPVARSYVADRNAKYPPAPGQFAERVRLEQRRNTPALRAAPMTPTASVRQQALARRAYDVLGSWVDVPKVWDELLRTGAIPSTRATDCADVSDEVFDAAVRAVQERLQRHEDTDAAVAS